MDSENQNEHAQADITFDLNFVPQWAREVPDRNPYAHFEGRPERFERDRRGRGRPGGPPRRPSDRGRPPRAPGDRPQGPRPHGREGRRPFRSREESRPEPEVRAPVVVSFIPERNTLGLIVRDLRNSGRAYPLVKLAHGFLSNPEHYLVKVEIQTRRDQPDPPPIFQCKECGIIFMDESALVAHAVAIHLETRFTREDREVDPPTGNFICVARCRLSGQILGPPNYHGYNERLLEIHRTRFAHMSLDDYRKQIETVRDPDLIEKWKDECRRQTVFRAKDAEGTEELSRREAEKQFLEKFAPSFAARMKRTVITPAVAARIEDRALRNAVRDAWTRESHRPFTLMLALRPAFHHMRLHLFKTRNGATFVSANAPHPLDSAHAVKPIADVLDFLRQHPGCTRQQLVEQLRPGAAPDSQAVSEVISPLRWLIEKGHVIEFFDGTLAIPSPGRKPSAS